MTKVEAILEQAYRLSASEREELLRLLAAQAFSERDDDDAAVGMRGVAAWTQSTQGEDWSAYYPDTLRQSGPAFS